MQQFKDGLTFKGVSKSHISIQMRNFEFQMRIAKKLPTRCGIGTYTMNSNPIGRRVLPLETYIGSSARCAFSGGGCGGFVFPYLRFRRRLRSSRGGCAVSFSLVSRLVLVSVVSWRFRFFRIVTFQNTYVLDKAKK